MVLPLNPSNDVPRILASVAKFAASDTCAETVIADTDRFVLEGVGEIVLSFRHGTHKYTDAFAVVQGVDIIPDFDDVGIVTEGNFPAIWR